MECPICMDDLHTNKNFISTECGHCFHASCLMANVAHNGFGCPYCRTVMTENVKTTEDDDEDDDYEDYDDEDDLYDDSTLRGFRFFMNNVSGESHDQEDLLEELNQEQEEDNREVAIINHRVMTQKLIRKGLTMDDVVKIVVLYEDAFARLHEIYNS